MSHAGGPRVQEQVEPRVGGHLLPRDLERLLVVGHARARAVRVGPLERDALRGQPFDDFPAQAADHAARLLAGRVEGIERIEHGRRRAAHERQPIDEQRSRAGTCRADRGRAARRARADDDDVVAVGDHCGGARANARAGLSTRIATHLLGADATLEPGCESPQQVAHARAAVVGAEVVAPAQIEAEQDAVAEAWADDFRDEPQQVTVRPVLDPAGRVVLEVHAARA